MMQILPVQSSADIATVARLAHVIWNEYYVPIIGQAQVDYMLKKFQRAESIKRQMQEGHEYFLIWRDTVAVGYFAVQSQPSAQRLFLSKLYVDKKIRGQGLGAAAMDYIHSLCKERGASRLWLTVNKHNPAKRIYERLGFEVVEEVVIDIGDGYVMDDYRMEKAVQ